ncbi:MAG: hypothetical protein HFJ35_00645 [Clostridia bacterium]|nr:hypothetical protein [Clostridia bacterium]
MKVGRDFTNWIKERIRKYEFTKMKMYKFNKTSKYYKKVEKGALNL